MKAQYAHLIAKIVFTSQVRLNRKQVIEALVKTHKLVGKHPNYFNMLVSNYILVEENGVYSPGFLCESYVKTPFLLYLEGSYVNARYELETYKKLHKRVVDVLAKEN
jgi:hypothetical protein